MSSDSRRPAGRMAASALVPAVCLVLVCAPGPAVLHGQQAGEQQVVLVRTGAGIFAEATPDGRVSTTKYVVPEGQEFCLTDIFWVMNGPPNESLTMGLVNANVDGTSDWRIWTVTATMNALREASGHSSFRTGPKIMRNGEIRWSFPQGLSGAAFTLYGRQRPASSAPCS